MQKQDAVVLYVMFDDYKFNHHVNSENGICEEECSEILKDFFRDLRKGQL